MKLVSTARFMLFAFMTHQSIAQATTPPRICMSQASTPVCQSISCFITRPRVIHGRIIAPESAIIITARTRPAAIAFVTPELPTAMLVMKYTTASEPKNSFVIIFPSTVSVIFSASSLLQGLIVSVEFSYIKRM